MQSLLLLDRLHRANVVAALRQYAYAMRIDEDVIIERMGDPIDILLRTNRHRVNINEAENEDAKRANETAVEEQIAKRRANVCQIA